MCLLFLGLCRESWLGPGFGLTVADELLLRRDRPGGKVGL